MRSERHSYDFVVVGGGMAGLLAALAAARRGAKTALVQDRPVLGGNASSEIRMHICGAHGANRRETGILEELLLENLYRNPTSNYSIWDSVLYGAAQYQSNLDLFLNCTVNALAMDGPRIQSLTAWQLTTETTHMIEGALFADCSGDGILAPLSGAEFRIGREARSEFGEPIAPVEGDRKTMGMSCLFQAREFPTPQTFTPPSWAYRFEKPEDLRGRGADLRKTNFWWMEVGGEQDSIHDTERLREELLRIAFGVWDHIKNHAPNKDQFTHWALDWMGFLPGKRESRRYLGDHILTQHDIESEGRFDDIVAYGGWSMDDHFPAGFYHPEAGTIFHPAPSPFGIPYRSLYSRNIENLFCAGRCHSATHAAMSATRVMATTSMMGQAVGTAAAIATRDNLTPRGVHEQRLRELQNALMDDDCWLPWQNRPVSELTRKAKLTAATGEAAQLITGMDRSSDDAQNLWTAPLGTAAEIDFGSEVELRRARIVFDSDLNRSNGLGGGGKNMRHSYPLDMQPFAPPPTLVKEYRLEAKQADGSWQTVHRETNNVQRLVRVPLTLTASALRLVPESAWGTDEARVFAFEAE